MIWLARIWVLAAGLSWFGGYWSAAWWMKWSIMMFGIIAMVSTQLPKRTHWSLWLAGVSTVAGAFYTMTFTSYAMVLTMPERVCIHQDGGYALAAFVGLAWFFATIEYKTVLAVEDTLAYLGLLEAVAIIWQTLHHMPHEARGGFMGNPSLSASFIAITYAALCLQPRMETTPSMLKTAKRWVYLSLPMIAILCTHSSMGVATLGVVLLVRNWREQKAALLVPAAVPILGWFMKGRDLVQDSGRFFYWKIGMPFWWRHTEWFWTGSGMGSLQRILPVIELRYGNVHPGQAIGVWGYFHNDWLDLLFMQGVVGLFAALAVAWQCWKRSAGRPALRAAVAGYCFCMLGNPLMHWPMHAMLGACIVALCFRAGEHHGEFVSPQSEAAPESSSHTP